MPGIIRSKRLPGNTSQQGFTIVELLVVIVILVILSVIVVALYDNIATRAYDASMNTDLKNAASQLEDEKIISGSYPATAAEANGGQGLKASDLNTLTYVRTPTGYCIEASNPDATTDLRHRSLNGSGSVAEGDCAPIVTLLAGAPSATGFADGSTTSARFNANDSNDIAITNDGTLYVSDINNRRIRMITPQGEVSTVAGNGVNGCFGGPVATAEIGRPLAIAWDESTDTLYFMGCDGHRLMKLTSDGNVSIVAGGRSGGINRCDGAVGTDARFYWSRGLTLGPDGYLYVSVTEMHHICKVNPVTGEAVTLAGSGVSGFADDTGTAAQFNWPWSSAFNSEGNLIVKDARNMRIREITPSGEVTTFAGSGASGFANGSPTEASFYYYGAHGMTIDQYDNLFVIESNSLRTVSPTGNVSVYHPFWNFPTSVGGYPQSFTFGPDGTMYAITPSGVIKIIL